MPDFATRTARAACFALLIAAAGGSHAASYVPDPLGTIPARSSGSASIVAREAPPRLQAPVAGTAPTTAVDGEGRNLSVSLPSTVLLYGVAHADEIAARTVVAPAGAGAARLTIALDRPVENAASAGAYVGVLKLTLDYN